MTRYFYGASHEEFPPEALLRHAVAAERAGFDGIGCSDHIQPWWEPGESGHAWAWLGATAQATEKVPFGTAVTAPGARYHPALIAQAWMTFERMSRAARTSASARARRSTRSRSATTGRRPPTRSPASTRRSTSSTACGRARRSRRTGTSA